MRELQQQRDERAERNRLNAPERQRLKEQRAAEKRRWDALTQEEKNNESAAKRRATIAARRAAVNNENINLLNIPNNAVNENDIDDAFNFILDLNA